MIDGDVVLHGDGFFHGRHPRGDGKGERPGGMEAELAEPETSLKQRIGQQRSEAVPVVPSWWEQMVGNQMNVSLTKAVGLEKAPTLISIHPRDTGNARKCDREPR